MGDDAAAAIAWAQSLGDKTEINRTIDRVARGWLLRNETAARAWIEGSSLPEESKKRLLERRR
jgi:hypothetical protein